MANKAVDDDEVEVVVTANTWDSEIADYLAEKHIKKNSSPFIWWTANYEKYPVLGQLVKRYLFASMGSVPSERKFKQAKRVVTGRLKLKAENVEKLLFLKYNLTMIAYDYQIVLDLCNTKLTTILEVNSIL